MDSWRFIVGVIRVGGVYGVGKTSTISQAVELCGREIIIMKGSEVMAEYLGCSPEELHLQTSERRQQAREFSYEVERSFTNGVKDSHFSVYNTAGALEKVTSDFGEVGVTALALVVASAATISARRMHIHRRRVTDVNMINSHLLFEKKCAYELSQASGIPLHIIDNEAGNGAVTEMCTLIERYVN